MSKQQEREQKILAFMRKELKAKGYPPTVREIGTALGIKSTSTVHKDIASLVEQGYLKKDPAKPRALMLVDGDGPDEAGEISNVSSSREDVIDVPVVGNVAAGTPILAEENIEDTFPVPAGFVKGDSFMLKVRGESMVNAGIMDGDLILVQQQNTAYNGEIVVAMVDGDFESEATVKTFYREDGHVRLQPENDTMDPIIVDDAKILGKVKGVFRYLS
ncbi:MAG TPA: transcriptional repressor LexA [Candidatus Avanaerovorax faecigallinarum]|nr:transcriptional repressor LexA [Candidatus Avanaerovorax faecigallinarum]